MLLGEYRQALDNKGQLRLPDQLLAILEGELVLTRGFDRNLLLFSGPEWRALAEKLLARAISSEQVRALRRRLFSAATEVVPDADGRIPIPEPLQRFAGINGEVVLAGMYDYLELWGADQWLPVLEAAESPADDGRWNGLGV